MLRTVSFLTPLAGLLNLQPPAAAGGGGGGEALCPFAMSVEGLLLASWALPLLSIAVFLLLWLLLPLVLCGRWKPNSRFAASFGALLLFLFSSLTSTTTALVQV